MSEHTAIYLSNYQASAFFIDTVALSFELNPACTRVTNTMQFYRDAATASTLVLHGEGQVLEALYLNDQLLEPSAYALTDHSLTVFDVPERFSLTVVSTCQPDANTALEGLYVSNAKFCTQCEPHGFRKITYYLDRPDVMAVFTTTISGDAALYPVMLSNGNCVSEELSMDGIKTVVWHDPFKKPCYLFALVAGDLACHEDFFVSMSGQQITLKIFVEPGNLDKTAHAMHSLKQAMRWDEQCYGREYDLAIFMIVAVSDFNMGAMENKGLNIFNAKYILANPETATDQDYEGITVVVGHEYFHNWTGNRITCRDWFQLSLKEGLTVFRDQEFSADMTSRPVARIDQVKTLKLSQFPEDAGPLAHPVRPISYLEMNNFYTATVYNKGAEVVRMLHTIEGTSGFRAGMDQYFARFDGMAVTCDDFVDVHAQANQADYTQFMRWYAQAGTPEITVSDKYNDTQQVYELTFSQRLTAMPDGIQPQPLVIPIRLGLLSEKGKLYTLNKNGDTEKVLLLQEVEQTFIFRGISHKPIPSLFRQFSAPVNYFYPYSFKQLLALVRFDVDAYNRFAAAEQLAYHLANNHSLTDLEQWLPVLTHVLTDCSVDDALKARILTLPSEKAFAQQQNRIDCHRAIASRRLLMNALAQGLMEHFLTCYDTLKLHNTAYEFSATQVGKRSLAAVCLRNLLLANPSDGELLCQEQYRLADNMTDRFHALTILVHHGAKAAAEACLADFYERYQHEALVVEKWFSIQATIPHEQTLARVENLLHHPAFDLKNPNKVRALIGAFVSQNFIGFHRADGAGYEFLASQIIVLNGINPQVAARLVEPLSHWQRYSDEALVLQRSALQRVLLSENLSVDVYEQVSKSLGSC